MCYNLLYMEVKSREVKGVVLGGGRGTRLAPLTERTSKQPLPIGDKPMVSRVIGQLSRAGIRDILLLIDQRHASQYLDTLRDGSDLGVQSLSYVWQNPDGKGLPTAINQVRNHVGDSKIVVACGDVLFDDGLEKPVEYFLNKQEILDKDKNRHTPAIVDIGTYIYPPDVFNKIDQLKPSERGETEIWELNKKVCCKRNIHLLAN